MTQIKEEITIAVVGDVHNLWDDGDAIALERLNVDLVLFVGDFGNEAVEIVRQIAAVKIPQASIMGNHDAWYSASSWGRQKAPYDHTLEDRVQQQLDLLGNSHVGFSNLDFPQFDLSVVGSRPFSWGGSTWRNSEFYRDRYGINSFEESTQQIVKSATDAIHETLIFIGHNGPHGLGDQTESICGRDWKQEGGDYGDPDLTRAIADVHSLGKSIPLVTFGHMHHELKNPQGKRRNIVEVRDNTVYLNAACVPRIVRDSDNLKRSFSLVTLRQSIVREISLVWLDRYDICSEEVLYQA
ncbi:TIGR04168 family protein [Pleurocapsales cyanobacterium LEGE 10410]|nr:TIGR04168 family protein [Pleurocapsales cyanobacterium LEGE 10410]